MSFLHKTNGLPLQQTLALSKLLINQIYQDGAT